MKARKPFEWQRFFTMLPLVVLSVVLLAILLVVLMLVYIQLGIAWAFALILTIGIGFFIFMNHWLIPRLASRQQTIVAKDGDDTPSSIDDSSQSG